MTSLLCVDNILIFLVGISTQDAKGLRYLYENADDFQVLPTFGVVPGFGVMFRTMDIPNLGIDFTQVLHGEQYLELQRPLPPEANIKLTSRVVDVLDKGSGSLYIIRGKISL